MTDLTEIQEWISLNEDLVIDSEIDHTKLNEGISVHSLKDFKKAYTKVDTKLIFYNELFLQPEWYEVGLITDDREIMEIKDEMNDRIEKYNGAVYDRDYSSPYLVRVYFLLEGTIINYTVRNNVFNDLDDPQEVFKKIEREVDEIYDEEKIKEMRIELFKKAKEDLKPITDSILQDDDFYSCTNSSLRLGYMKQLLINHPEYKEKIHAAGYYKTSTYADYVWKLYKDSKKI